MSADESGYTGRIGRYGPSLALGLMQAAGVRRGQRALDVGCGQGALTAPLTTELGAANVCAIDPDESAVRACRANVPGADVRVGVAEELPFRDGEFDVVLAQLVVSLMTDARAGMREMRRVARKGGLVGTCVWDFAEGMTVLRAFWDAATAQDPAAARHDQAATRPFASERELGALARGAGLTAVQTGALTASAAYSGFDDLWHPLVAPDGSPGAYFATLDPPAREALRDAVWERLARPRGPFRLDARAWYVTGRA
jgi:ubiquinone/menaquinone biosynthesis C-methylase UbiE